MFIRMTAKTKTESRKLDNNNLIRFPLDASFQEVRRLFVLAFDNTDNGANKQPKKIISSKSKYKKLQCTNWWQKTLWSTN